MPSKLAVTENKQTGGGSFDPSDRYQYFLAGKFDKLEPMSRFNRYLLVAVNELRDQDLDPLRRACASGTRVLLDSGIFNLAMTHAKKHGVSHDRALSLQPEEVDGFEALLDRYLTLINDLKNELWGYVELDLGGAETKRRTRAMLENEHGIAPIPVYHPFGDGWDYFDELASGYDRICVGNIVQASAPVRTRILATIEDRRRAHPGLKWVHALGLTPNELYYAYTTESCDSSSWLASVRWKGDIEHCAGKTIGYVVPEFNYVRGDTPSHHEAIAVSSYSWMMHSMNLRHYRASLEGES